jgi:hypothetical protein
LYLRISTTIIVKRTFKKVQEELEIKLIKVHKDRKQKELVHSKKKIREVIKNNF